MLSQTDGLLSQWMQRHLWINPLARMQRGASVSPASLLGPWAALFQGRLGRFSEDAGDCARTPMRAYVEAYEAMVTEGLELQAEWARGSLRFLQAPGMPAGVRTCGQLARTMVENGVQAQHQGWHLWFSMLKAADPFRGLAWLQSFSGPRGAETDRALQAREQEEGVSQLPLKRAAGAGA